MKKIIQKLFPATIMVLILISFHAMGQTGPLFAVMQNGKTGFIDKAGKLIVPCQYDPFDYYTVSRFSEGLMPIRQNGMWGALDGAGKVVINPLYAEQLFFSETGYAYAKVKQSGTNPNPYAVAAMPAIIIDKKGNRVLPGEYKVSAFVGGISGDILTYFKDNQYSFINIRTKQESGKWFASLGRFKNGAAVAQQEEKGKYGLIDEKGNWLIQPQFYNITVEEQALLIASLEDRGAKWALIDRTGKTVGGPFTQYEIAFGGGSGLLCVKDVTTGFYGYMNGTGKLPIPCTLNGWAFLFEGIALVNTGGIKEPGRLGMFNFKNADWKAINANGKVLFNLPQGCTAASVFREGRCVVTFDDKIGVIDIKGNFIVPAQSKIKLDGFFNGLCLFENEKGIGYYDLNGKVVWEASR